MKKFLFKSLMYLFNFLIICVLVFLFNHIYELGKLAEKNKEHMIPHKKCPSKRRARRRIEMKEHEWYKIEEKEPPPGSYILVEINGNKLFNYIKMEVREGEGLGHIKRWRFITQEEKQIEEKLSFLKDEKKITLW